MAELTLETITFGKYNGSSLQNILKDRCYCKWILEQDWFKTNYEYLYNRIKEYDPKKFFFNESVNDIDFIKSYPYFNLINIDKLEDINLSVSEKVCYKYYLESINDIKNKIVKRTENKDENIFDIKAPVKWLQKFEKDTNISRDVFKDFLLSYELQNIPYIIEDVKKQGGIEYKGAQSFNIAKKRSNIQEKWWESILKEKYGENISTQFKYEDCIFDFINISTNTIFECKLNLKDFNEEQYRKYLVSLKNYRIIYLIGVDCVINIEKSSIYTTDRLKYILCKEKHKKSKFDELIKDYEIIKVDDISSLFGK